MSQATVQHILGLVEQLSHADRELFDQQLAEHTDVGPRQEAGQALRGAKMPETAQTTIEEAIELSRGILDMPEDWDGEGPPAYSEATWQRATSFVRNYAQRLWAEHAVRIPAPQVLPGPDASIDVHWEEESFELLVNIPADDCQRAEFYGDDYGAVCIKGNLDPAVLNRGLIEWLQNAG